MKAGSLVLTLVVCSVGKMVAKKAATKERLTVEWLAALLVERRALRSVEWRVVNLVASSAGCWVGPMVDWTADLKEQKLAALSGWRKVESWVVLLAGLLAALLADQLVV